MKCISYTDGYKYQLDADYSVLVEIKPGTPIVTEYIQLDADGVLSIKEGYAWDGPSGPTIDTSNFMRGSLIHDALYQLMREGKLDHNTWREAADRELQRACKEDGMSPFRSWYVYHGVRLFGDPSADPAHRRLPIKAPEGCEG